MAWYRSGTVSVTNGSATVTGSGTDWVAGVGIGEAFNGPDGKVYEIASIVSATQLTLGSVYLGATASGQAYQIIPSQSYIRDLAAQAAQLVSDYASVVSNAGSGKFTDGTAAAPGIRFTADENVGIRRAGADDMRLVANGQDKVTITGSGVSIPTLTSNPTLSAGTANGVLYLNGSKVATSGSALTFDGTTLGLNAGAGNMRVGAAGDTSTHYFRAVDNGGQSFYFGIDNSAGSFFGAGAYGRSIYSEGNYPIQFVVNSAEQMRLTSTGLGIGTSSPASKLNVQADDTNTIARQITISGATSSNKCLYLGFNTSTNVGTIQAYEEGFGKRDLVLQPDSGNLGLGVIPSAWGTAGSAYKAFQYGISGFLAGRTGNEIAILGTGAYHDGTNWRYTLSGNFASHYSQASGQHTWYTAPSGTAGEAISFTLAMDLGNSAGASTLTVNSAINNASAIRLTTNGALNAGMFLASPTVDHSLGFQTAGSERARIDSSGNLLVGTTSNAFGNPKIYTNGAISLAGGQSILWDGTLRNPVFTVSYDGVDDYLRIGSGSNTGNTVASHIQFYTGPSTSYTERARIDSSGNLLVGTTSAYGVGLTLKPSGEFSSAYSGTSGNHCLFLNNNGTVGSITSSGSTTFYNTGSDYRLKNITGPVTNSGAYIDSLNPVEGTWKADGSTFVGLIAHEVQEVSRTQVATGEKDGEQMQAMDYSNSELIANLIAEVQALRKRVAQLEAR